jgi:hypothetical protein
VMAAETLSLYCCYIPMCIPLTNFSEPKAFVTNEGYQVVMTTNMSVKKSARRMHGSRLERVDP